MKNLLLLSLCVMIFSTTSFAIHPTASDSSAPASVFASTSVWSQLTQDEILTLTPKQIKQKTGQKLKFKEKIALSLGRKAYKKALKKQKKAGNKSNLDKTSVASFVLSTLGLIGLFITFVLWWLAIPGLILGIIALTRKGNYDSKGGKGFAIAGTIIGGLSVLLFVVIIALVISFI